MATKKKAPSAPNAPTPKPEPAKKPEVEKRDHRWLRATHALIDNPDMTAAQLAKKAPCALKVAEILLEITELLRSEGWLTMPKPPKAAAAPKSAEAASRPTIHATWGGFGRPFFVC